MIFPPIIEKRVVEVAAGFPRQIKVRALLKAFNQERRGGNVVKQINEALALRGVKLIPNLDAPGLSIDDSIGLYPIGSDVTPFPDQLVASSHPDEGDDLMVGPSYTEPATSFESFKESWLAHHMEGKSTSIEKGNAFAAAILQDWLDLNEFTEEPLYCDGSGDGGVDAAIYVPMDPSEEGTGDTWYLIQSKFGSAFTGSGTVMLEGRKVVRFLCGEVQHLNGLTEGLLGKLRNYRKAMGPDDRIVLVLATVDAMSADDRESLTMVRAYGKEKLGANFEVEAISLETIYAAVSERRPTRLRVALKAKVIDAGRGLKIGGIGLVDLYEFLKSYRQATGDLDRLYDRNVRRFLGGRGPVNRDMAKTLLERPANFGLFNNGITLVAESIEDNGDGVLILSDPAVVNGCQTTRTVWAVLDANLAAGGTGKAETIELWKEGLAEGAVVAKIVSLEAAHEAVLPDITRYTNSQNKVQDKDFLALESDFQRWARELASKRHLYLEIQRGGWDSMVAWQKQNLPENPLKESANAAELIKVYAAGWLSMPGRAMSENRAFTPGGVIYREITDSSFGADDLYAAYLLRREKDRLSFGARTTFPARGQTKFLFYAVTVDLVKHVLARAGRAPSSPEITRALIRLFDGSESGRLLTDRAALVIDQYMTPGNANGATAEPLFIQAEKGDMNAFLKSSELKPGGQHAPKLTQMIELGKMLLAERGLSELLQAIK